MGLRLVTADGTPAPVDVVAAGEPAGRRRATVPVDSLLDSDSPRIDGEDGARIQMLARLESPLPPILVHRETMRVIDGMHRLRAVRLRGDDTIDVEFFEGGEVEAFTLAVWLNITHGLPLSKADRTAAAKRILRARPYWSDRRIAANAGLAAGTVASIRRRSTGQNEQLNARVGRDGRVRPLLATEGRPDAAADAELPLDRR
ncbi:ParB/RepB/Spo0J family partition protein [Streptomyces sp. NPDC050448]|uniref:ParB/RepB/Spo0J family partition protein n=1 Tax=Streptomyces sp. NPDC050448 TaxID=3155404 RepID=UPI00342FCD9D